MKTLNAGKTSMLVLISAFAVAAFLLGRSINTVSAVTDKVSICHWDEGKNAYKPEQDVNYSSIYKWDNGHDECKTEGHGKDPKDIIPAFVNGDCSFPGLNTDKVDWIANDCKDPSTPSEDEDAVCGETLNTCSTGTFEDKGDTDKEYKWDCKGIGDGKDAHCKLDKEDEEKIDGLCGEALNSCSAGTFEDKTDSDKEYKWDCKGIDGGKTAHCTSDKPDENPTDVCSNLDGDQATLPDGMQVNSDNFCSCKEGYHEVNSEGLRVAEDGLSNFRCEADETEPTPEPTPNGDVCYNLPGIQTGIPDGYHKDTPDGACNQFQFGGAPAPQGGEGSVLGTSTGTGGQVLGAKTMAGTGTFEEMLYQVIIGVGGTLTGFGLKNFKKASKKA